MALIVRNTFLDVVEQTPAVSDRRCHSVPRQWKESTPTPRLSIDDRMVSPLSPDASTRGSLPSDHSFFSDEASPNDDFENDMANSSSMPMYFKTPTSSVASPRACGCSARSEVDNIISSYLKGFSSEIAGAEVAQRLDASASTSAGYSESRGSVPERQPGFNIPQQKCGRDVCAPRSPAITGQVPHTCMYPEKEPWICSHDQDQDAEYDRCKSSTPTCPIGSSIFNPPDHSESSKERKAWEDKTAETARHSTQAKPGVNAQASHPQLKEEGSQDKPVNTRANALVNAVHSAVLSCGRAQQVTIDRDFQGSDGKPTMLISAEVEDGLHASSRSYDVVHVAKQALDAAVAQTKTVKFVSARVQKEDSSYSLRSSIACVPEGVQDRLCWDMFQKGYCNRGMQCRWTHLKNTQCDIVRVKVSVKRAGETSDISSEEQFGFKSSTRRTARSSRQCM